MGIKNPVALYWKQRFVSEASLQTSLSMLAVCPAAVLTPRRACSSGGDTAAPVPCLVCRVPWEPGHKHGTTRPGHSRNDLPGIALSIFAYVVQWVPKPWEEWDLWGQENRLPSHRLAQILPCQQYPVAGSTDLGQSIAPCSGHTSTAPGSVGKIFRRAVLQLTTQIYPFFFFPWVFFITSEIKKSSNDKPSGIGFFSKEKNEIDVSWQELSERFPPPPSVYILCRELYRKMG